MSLVQWSTLALADSATYFQYFLFDKVTLTALKKAMFPPNVLLPVSPEDAKRAMIAIFWKQFFWKKLEALGFQERSEEIRVH